MSKYYFLSLFRISLFFSVVFGLAHSFSLSSSSYHSINLKLKDFFLNKVLEAINRQNEEGRGHLRVIENNRYDLLTIYYIASTMQRSSQYGD